MKTTTAIGIPIARCKTCHDRHPVNRKHCVDCGVASIFHAPDGRCLKHTKVGSR